ncbi:peptidoglycan-binding domain-containing protein, partial [Planococcus sp. SIMBA_160]
SYKGAGVKAVQQALAAAYYYPDKGAKNNGVDGYYGPKTANAVKRFQLMNGLAADGIYGPKTKAALEKAMK